ncbi:MAG: hypothetical protein ABI700_20530, partial [Chloroflexota bacterium]
MSAVTLQVWNALKRPPIHHPLFRRASQKRPPVPAKSLSTVQRITLSVLFALLAYVGLRYFSQLVFIIVFFIPIAIAGVYMALHGTLAGLYWAIRVGSAIARERERGTFELLSTSPYGPFSASWAICTGCQYYDQTFNGVGAQRVWFSRIFFLTLLLMSGLLSLPEAHGLGVPNNTSANFLESLLSVIEMVCVLALAFQIDDIHSTVIGSLVGVIVPLFARNRLDARIGAFVGFLVLQITAYIFVWVIGFMAIPELNANLSLSATVAALALPLEQLVVFFIVRECIARVLWGVNYLLLDGDVS